MPIHNTFVLNSQGQPHPQGLQLTGPLLQVEISVHPSLAQFLEGHGQSIPPPMTGQSLIDTGAGNGVIGQYILSM